MTHALAQHGSSAGVAPDLTRALTRLLDETLRRIRATIRRWREREDERARSSCDTRDFTSARGTTRAPEALPRRARSLSASTIIDIFRRLRIITAWTRARRRWRTLAAASDPLSSVSLCALVARRGRRERRPRGAPRRRGRDSGGTTRRSSWRDRITRLRAFALREADLAYRAALFVSATSSRRVDLVGER